MNTDTFFNTQPGPFKPIFIHKLETVIVEITLPEEGDYVIFGKVSIANWDGDYQDATATLLSKSGAQILDQTVVRLGKAFGSLNVNTQDNQQCFHVQAPFRAPKINETIQIICATYNGSALYGSLIALSVHSVAKTP